MIQVRASDETNGRRRIRVLGARLDAVSSVELMNQLDAMVESRTSHYVCFCGLHLSVLAAQEADVRNALEGASLVLPDGVAVTVGARLVGHRFPERLPGPVAMLEYCRHGVERGRRHFFYGGGEGVAERLAQRLRSSIPGLQVVGTCCPPFRPLTGDEEEEVKQRIEDANPDVLWVGLGAPKQERWVAEHVNRIQVPLMMAVGAAFDYHSGNTKWAPTWVRKAGLEWAYRMATGGRRIAYRMLKYGPIFVLLIFGQAAARVWRGDMQGNLHE